MRIPTTGAFIWSLFLLTSPLLFSPQTVWSQTNSKSFGLGVQVGSTSGLSMKLYLPRYVPGKNTGATRAIDAVLAWDLNTFFFVNSHILAENPIDNSPLRYFIGPGMVAGIERGDFVLGASGNLGLNFDKGRFEVYLQLTPRLSFLPRIHGEFGAGVGLRFYW